MNLLLLVLIGKNNKLNEIMGKWSGNIEIKKEWIELKEIKELDADPAKRTEQLKPFIDKLKAQHFFETSLIYKDLVQQLEDCDNWQMFNEIWDELYNWADYHRVFINTLF